MLMEAEGTSAAHPFTANGFGAVAMLLSSAQRLEATPASYEIELDY